MQAPSEKRSRSSLWSLAALSIVAGLWMPSRAAAQQNGQQEKPKPSGTSSYDQVTPVLLGQQDFETMMAKDKANKGGVEDRQKRLLEERYDLSVRVDPSVKMTRGKPIPVGPATKLPPEMTWEKLAGMAAEEIREQDLFPKGFLPLPHPHHEVGGMVFPQEEVKLLARLARFDLDFDLPAHFLPEFPPAIFLTTRHDLGDVSQGKMVTLDNYYELFNGILNAKDMEGMRLLVSQFPQQQFNATADRKAAAPSQGVACLDCHVNGHTSGATHLVGDIRPQSHRRRIETPSLRGVYAQRLFGSQRALKSIEDFTEFEQRAAYFDGDHLSASAKGVNPLDRGSQVHFMSEVQELFDFPPAPGLGWDGKLDPKKFGPDSPEMVGQRAFFGKARCAECHPAPFYTDNLMHDLQVERFYKDRTINGLVATSHGPIKTFPLRGIKESPPYFHDGRLLTLEDTVEFFNLVLELHLDQNEKAGLVAFLRQL
jgi:cytochrome c peroxidase